MIEPLRAELEGAFLDRIVVPERSEFPGGFLKGEWALRFASRRKDMTLLISVRPRHPYVAVAPGKGPKAAQGGTRSPFDLAAGKLLKGAKLDKIEALPRERIVIFHFQSQGEALGLVVELIPALPEALLVKLVPGSTSWPILARSRTLRVEGPAPTHYTPPSGERVPPELAVREALTESPEVFSKAVEAGLQSEAFELRLTAARRALRERLAQAHARLEQSQRAAREAHADPDWRRLGELMKASLHEPPPLERASSGAGAGGKPGETSDTAKTKKKTEGGKPDKTKAAWVRRLTDWDTGLEVAVECDPQLEPQAQAERFFQLARRRQRRIEEAESRARTFGEAARGLEKALAQAPAAPDWASLHRLEQLAGAAPKAPLPAGGGGKNKAAGAWLGKRFASKDGMAILVGRSKDENLELTFKVARGNDVWLHVRGRPGAHGLIPLTSGKSAPLDTLLDAAVLTLYYSGGEHWGKTEVDYTFKKYVKRIKDSTEASYTNNKTLIVEVDPSRLKRLMATQDV